MRYLFLIIVFGLGVGACSPRKPELSPTQVVNGKSIIIPPEFDIVPGTTDNKQ